MTCIPAFPATCVDEVAGGVKDAVTGTVETVSTVGSWASDPFGNLAELARSGTEGLVNDVLPWFVDALEPNLSTGWFLDMYAATFGLAVGVWALILMWGLVSYGRGKQGPAETIDMLTSRSAVFLVGAMFGPAIGTFLITVVGALTKGVIKVFVGSSADQILDTLGGLVEEGSTEAVIGGSLVAALIFGVMFLGLFFVLITLLVMLIACYFSGVVFPLGWVWVTREKTSKKGMKIVWVFVGILLAHPLLFLMLGVSLNLAGASVFGGSSELTGSSEAPTELRYLVSILLATIAMWMTAMSPAMLAKFAPVLPTEGDIGGIGGGDMKAFVGGGGSGDGGSGLGNLSQANAGGNTSGGDFGGNDILSSQAAGGPGPNTGAESGEASSGMGTAAAEGAATGAEEGAELGAETGPGAAATAGVGAAVGATAGVVTEGGKEAMEEANRLAGESSESGGNASGDSADSGDEGALSSASSKSGPGSGGQGSGGFGDAMNKLSDMAVEQMDDYVDPDRFGR